jgi:uncharacterized protein involved in copper resistance
VTETQWAEYGLRLGYKLDERTTLDAHVYGAAGDEIGSDIHGGLGLRLKLN